jgi:hypothetical protein
MARSEAGSLFGLRVSDFFRVSGFGLRILLAPLLITAAHAQSPLSNLVFAVGTTWRDNASQDWSYVLLDNPDDRVVAGRRFAVFGKPGDAGSTNAFTQRGTMSQQTDAAGVNALLNQSVALGDDLLSLSNALNLMFRSVPGFTNLTLAQKVLTSFQAAATDEGIAELLSLIGKGHPGFNLCRGRAFSEMQAGLTTYELRELDPVTSAPSHVVGRVTIMPNAPVVLPAPGRPFQVVTNGISDHLRVRLRWGAPPELRRLSPLQFGYNVWRIPRAAAEAGNFHVTPPPLAVLYGNTNFLRASAAPVMASMEFDPGSGVGGAENPADRHTYFFADTGRATGSVFTNGQEFYYFATARDILGRDGLVSTGALARACRRLPPAPPRDLRVENTVLPGSTNQPRLFVHWEQNTNTTNAVTHYWIYRWTNPASALTNDAAPTNGRIAIVTQAAGTNRNSFLDTTPGALTDPNLTNVWFTIRAVSESACDPLLSTHSPPAWGVMRQREGPEATTGELLGSCGIPVVMFQNFATNAITTDEQTWNFRLSCMRRDRGIEWVQFNITDTVVGVRTNVNTVGPVYFAPDEDVAQLDYPVPAGDTYAHTFQVSCTVGTFHGQVSAGATCTLTAPVPPWQQREAVFFAGQLLTTALSGSDPLLTVLNNGNNLCYTPLSITPDPSGMVALTFPTTLVPVLVQALTNNTWFDVAVVWPDSTFVYWVSYPACLIGPLPQFRGCVLNLPETDPDCDQHVARAADNGQVAPIRVRFKLTERTREYRVYRRAGDGPLTLFAQGPAAYDPLKPNKLIESKDEAMPVSPTRLCYFVQTLDEHGNGSPLAFIGCKPVGKLPRPVLAEPIAMGTNNNAQVMLNWFCPTSGVARFRLLIHRVDKPKPLAEGEGIDLSSPDLAVSVPYNNHSSFLGLNRKKKAARQLYDEARLTALIGPGFGPGPQFTLTANILANATYEVTVAAVDEQGKPGPNSESWQFTWTPPVATVTVPWPARPAPPVRDFDSGSSALPYAPRVQAKVFYNSAGTAVNPRYPVGVRIGEVGDDSGELTENAITENSDEYVEYSPDIEMSADPNASVFRAQGGARAGQSLLPFVLYREQLTNALFPRVSGDITQVSPLIERVPWKVNSDSETVLIPDRLFAGQYEDFGPASYFFFYVRDLQPVQRGAKYRYYVVRFNAQREVEETIPAGDVTLPLN